MSEDLTVTIDAAALRSALERIPEAVLAHVYDACGVTAQRVAAEARARVHRSQLPHDHTQDHIVVRDRRRYGMSRGYRVEVALPVEVEPGRSSDAAIVYHTMPSGRKHTQIVTQNNRPIWLEYGTKHMAPIPFLTPAAQLEEGAHFRRVTAAIQEAIDDGGLGGR